VAIGAVPEGLPLLAGVAQAAIARRLGARNAFVRHLAAVEALGRVDVVCTDKTGTLTEGRPALTRVSLPDGRGGTPDEPGPDLRRVLAAAALASPHPDAPALASHPTDVAVVEGAQRAGLTASRDARRQDEVPFEPSRGFHATRADGRLFVKGAAEEVLARCDRVRGDVDVRPLSDGDREGLLSVAESLSGEGLRVLMVAERPSGGSTANPTGLTALGFLGISDPLRPGVAGPYGAARRPASGS
jgi:cation-transporting ATPase I